MLSLQLNMSGLKQAPFNRRYFYNYKTGEQNENTNKTKTTTNFQTN